MQLRRKDTQAVEIQMGPMIDMVFLLLVFFMVSAKPIKQESDIDIGLPGTVAQEEIVDIPDEQKITIQSDGQVILNDILVDNPNSKDLPVLKKILLRFKESADANRSKALVTVDAHDQAKHQRIIDVLNVVSQSGIQGVTFADAMQEEDF